MVAYAGMKVPQKDSFKVQFILHVRFVASSINYYLCIFYLSHTQLYRV